MQTVVKFEPELLLRAQDVRVVFLDVDGVLTDGGLYFSEQGESLKRFCTLDGHGLKMVQRAGILPVVITGRDSQSLRMRLKGLGIDHAHFNVQDKLGVAQSALDTLGYSWHQAAAMGDDWPDLPVMLACGLACAPGNAHDEVKARAHCVTQRQGGDGAVRELCDLLLVASGAYFTYFQEVLP